MENFSFLMPTKVFFGRGAVAKAKEGLALGKKALIVTGKSSAQVSGALDDVLAVLPTDYEIFAQVENNPTVENVVLGGEVARKAACDYIVAIGGGSPLDAAKVIALLAKNQGNPLDFYKKGWPNRALPLAAIPTTAGTGSEVTPYAVLTISKEETKKGLKGPDLFPKTAYLDPRYTESLPEQVTVDTAVDALSHLVEGYLANRATPASDFLAAQGLRLWGENITPLLRGDISEKERAGLLLASLLGGITIAQTGTALVHALGYSLTYFHNFPHGRANAVFLTEYLRYTKTVAKARVLQILEFLGLPSLDAFGELMSALFQERLQGLALSGPQVEKYVQKALLTHNISNSRGEPQAQELTKIVLSSIMA